MADDRVSEPTLASTCHAASSAAIADELLDWPPDVFALANVILARSEAFRFALSPIQEWPPEGYPDWGRMVEEGGLRWGARVEHRRGPPPKLVGQEWAALKEGPMCWSSIWPRASTRACPWRCSLSTPWPTRRAPGSESHSTLRTRWHLSTACRAGLVRRVLLVMLEERRTRQAASAPGMRGARVAARRPPYFQAKRGTRPDQKRLVLRSTTSLSRPGR
jgi:hypothetical protein